MAGILQKIKRKWAKTGRKMKHFQKRFIKIG